MSFQWTDLRVREALRLPPGHHLPSTEYVRICTDSRQVEAGDLFVALSGDRFDGHDFVDAVVDGGARGCVVSKEVAMGGGLPTYRVSDTLQALGELALYRRQALQAPVVGITGSSGKTTTKDLLKEALQGTLRVHATQGNLNNRIGVPLTLLAAPDTAEVVVLEMGTNEPGEIRALTHIAQPQIGVITTVSETHLEKLGSLEGVLEEKLDLFRGLRPSGLAVVGDEPPELGERARDLVQELLVTGWGGRASPENRPESPEVSEDGCYHFRWRGESVNLRMPGRHTVQNALLALAVADALGVSAGDAARRIGAVQAGGMRSEIRSMGSMTLLVDCYNANPQSLRAALDLLTTLKRSGPRVAVLGSMLELGEESRSLHRKSLEETLSYPLDLVVATGLFAEVAGEMASPSGAANLLVAPELEQAREVLLQVLGGTEVVLLKASRGVAMESLIPSLEDRFGPGVEG